VGTFWALYALQYLGAGLLFVSLNCAARMTLNQYGSNVLSGIGVGLGIVVLGWCQFAAQMRIFYTIRAWRKEFGEKAIHGEKKGIHKMLDSDEYSWYVLSTIVLGSILLAIATDKEWRESSIIILGLIVVMASFVLLEITPKMIAECPRVWLYFHDPWNLFDLFVLVLWLVNIISSTMSDDIDEPLHNHFVVLILRLFKLTQYVHIWSPFQGLKVVMRVTLSVLPNALWIFMVILIMLYMFGCYAAYCFQDNDAKYFDSLFHAIIAGFSIITRRWSIYFYVQYYGCDETYSEQEIANYGCDPNKQPVLALLVFPIFILTVSYIFLQLLLAVICEKWNLVSAKVQLDDWLEAEREDPGSGGPPVPEVSHLLSRMRTAKMLKKLAKEAKAYKADAAKFRRMMLYLQPRVIETQQHGEPINLEVRQQRQPLA